MSEERTASRANTMIRSCSCSDPYQDKKHGKGQRAHNRTGQNKPESERKWRCTSCGRVA